MARAALRLSALALLFTSVLGGMIPRATPTSDDCDEPTSTSTTSTTPSTTAAPTAVSSGCYPTHGSNVIDSLISVGNLDVHDFCTAAAPATTTSADVVAFPSDDNQANPVNNNYYQAYYHPADGRPSYCDDVYKNKTDFNAFPYQACMDPLGAIVKTCPMNGGWVSNADPQPGSVTDLRRLRMFVANGRSRAAPWTNRVLRAIRRSLPPCLVAFVYSAFVLVPYIHWLLSYLQQAARTCSCQVQRHEGFATSMWG